MTNILEHIADALEVGLEDGGGDDNSVAELDWDRGELQCAVDGRVTVGDFLDVMIFNQGERYRVRVERIA